MVASISAQDQIATFIAEMMPEKIMQFKFAPKIQERILDLVERKKNQTITVSEKEELEKYLTYDLLIGLAKARAAQNIKKDL